MLLHMMARLLRCPVCHEAEDGNDRYDDDRVRGSAGMPCVDAGGILADVINKHGTSGIGGECICLVVSAGSGRVKCSVSVR